jgi:hypothetical protein
MHAGINETDYWLGSFDSFFFFSFLSWFPFFHWLIGFV